MIDKILTILKTLVALLPFVLLCMSSKKVNLQKLERSKQFLMPIITVIYVIAVMIFQNSINDLLLKLINNIPKWLAALAGFSWMPERVGSLLLLVSQKITDFLKGLNLNYWIFYISNTAIILVYLILKTICIKIMSAAVKQDGTLHGKIAGNFYEFFPEKNIWCVQDSYAQARTLLQVFYYTAVILSCLLMLVSRKYYFDGLLKAMFYPVFGILVVGELYFFLDGITKREYTADILGEDEEAYKIVNYSLLRKFLRSIFGDKLLTENTGINNALAYDVTTDDILRELEKSEDQKVVSFATYFSALNKTGAQIDHNYLYSSLDMLNGKSILFNNPFYNDLIPYAFYPMNRVLLSHKKVLVVLGRHSSEGNITEWLEKGIEAVTNIPFMWNIGVLGRQAQDLDVGIITRSDVLDIELQNANADFLEEVGFVVVIEPSKLISTAQIGLNLIAKRCSASGEKEPVYCLCDKNCDGLVDAMSHILMTSITEVSATKKHLGTSSYMCWETDQEYLHHRLVPNISRYLGMGTELSFAALKNQVSKVKWYGGEAFPVTDIRWIDKQYYYDLTKYAGLPTSQEAIDEHFLTSPDFWSAEVARNNYFTVEDEAFNMFEILRNFSTRSTEQGFINVISSEYLLKDYMADNASIFEADAKAIPQIVADYTRSNRNTTLRLVLMMSTFPVAADVLEKELSLLGIRVLDLKKQLWYELYNCYSDIAAVEEVADQAADYGQAVAMTAVKPITMPDGTQFDSDIIVTAEAFNLKKGKMETTYAITDPAFLCLCVSELRSAGYVAEDEKGQKYYLGSELSGHIYQKYLPGQFFTFDGKYYEMQYLTADGQILMRRAADHIDGRPAYRQLRNYTLHAVRASGKIGSQKDIGGLKVAKEYADISVQTPGYYRMDRYSDFAGAKKISFEGAKNGIPVREYHNKEILRIELPAQDGKLNDNIRYTITVLLNEVFRTLFAEDHAYICAVTDTSFLGENATGEPLTYRVDGNADTLRSNSIYIVEDSQLDLGLIVAVERNLQRILKIVCDYLDWHFAALEASLNPPPDPQPPIVFDDPDAEKKPKKHPIKAFFAKIGRAFRRLIDKIKGWFKRKPKKQKTPEAEEPVPETDVPAVPDNVSDPGDGTALDKPVQDGEKPRKGLFGWLKRKKRKKSEAPPEEVPRVPAEQPEEEPATPDAEELPADDEAPVETADPEDAQPAQADGTGSESAETVQSPAGDSIMSSNDVERIVRNGFVELRKPYHERYYLLFGQDAEPASMDLAATAAYLRAMGLSNNQLKQAREGKKIAQIVEATFQPGKPNARYCDFCGAEIFGVEYETLADGRDRCLNCGRTAIKTGEEFRKIFDDVKRNMESFFGIRINAGIKVEMVNSRTLHKRLGKAFIPTPKSDGRVLGVAISDRHGYTLMVESGSPRMASMLTMAHELTHIWQYIHWNDKAIRRKYGRKLRLEIYEGMAKWVEIQYAYLINEPAVAKREEIITAHRDDAYGRGYLRYRANYPFSLGTVVTRPMPFMDLETPLDPQFCGPFTVVLPPSDTNGQPSGPDDTDPPPTGGGDKPSTPVKGPIQRKPGEVYRYAYGLLSEDEKKIYDVSLAAINDFTDELRELPAQVSNAQAEKILAYVQKDHPEIFWFQHGATFYFDTATNIVNKLSFQYCMTKEEAQLRQQKIDAAILPFVSSVGESLSDYEVTLRVYENIIKLVDYDTLGLEKQTTVTADKPDDLRSIYGVFVNKKAVCAGYAKATQYLLNRFGIECTYVTSSTHAWNLLKLEGDYYHLDTTWGDSSDTKKEKDISDRISYDCFCITTEEVLRLDAHTPDENYPLPVCTATKCNYHHRHGLFLENYDFDKIRQIVCKCVQNGCLDVCLKFADAKVFDQAKKSLIDNGKFREAIQYANLKPGVRLDSGYRYTFSEERRTLSVFLRKL